MSSVNCQTTATAGEHAHVMGVEEKTMEASHFNYVPDERCTTGNTGESDGYQCACSYGLIIKGSSPYINTNTMIRNTVTPTRDGNRLPCIANSEIAGSAHE